MSEKDLYKEALADVKRLRELAIKDAQNTILESLTPKIKEFVEEHLLETSVEGPPRITNNNVNIEDEIDTTTNIEQTISTPEVSSTADCVCTFEALPQFNELVPALRADKQQFEPVLSVVDESIRKTLKKIVVLSERKSFNVKIDKIITDLQNMYEYVQEVVSDPARKVQINLQLESYFKDLKQFKEDAMKNKKRLFEADELEVDTNEPAPAADQVTATKKVSLNLNVPEDIADKVIDSLSDIEISLDGDEAEGQEEVEMGGEEGDEDLDIDLNVSDEGGEDEELQLSSKQMDDDTVVEIDEAMLRTELKKMRAKSIKESGVPTPSADGAGVDATALAAFGGGADAGDPFVDGEVETAETQVAESIKRETKLQQLSQARISKLQAEGRIAKANKNVARFNALKTAYLAETKKLAESVKRMNVLKERKSGCSNSNTLAESRVGKKLAETNLDNAKLVYANKTLQSNLSNDKKLKIVEQLDTAKTPVEAKLIYENAIKLLSVNENVNAKTQTNNAGSASRSVQSGGASQRLNEGYEMNRWSRLAGLDK